MERKWIHVGHVNRIQFIWKDMTYVWEVFRHHHFILRWSMPRIQFSNTYDISRNVDAGRFKSMHCNLFSLRCSAVFHLHKFQKCWHQMWKNIQVPFTYQYTVVCMYGDIQGTAYLLWVAGDHLPILRIKIFALPFAKHTNHFEKSNRKSFVRGKRYSGYPSFWNIKDLQLRPWPC